MTALSSLSALSVYPRVCGGTPAILGTAAVPLGLSPRVRGNPSSFLHLPFDLRSIPACAGEPSPQDAHAQNRGVYPRVCGGTHLRQRPVANVPGLSPRVRGNRCGHEGGRGCSGSIPACAGEPFALGTNGKICMVYPRVCGGTRLDFCLDCVRLGLSPRVRGNLQDCQIICTSHRSIPACAGEPHPSSCATQGSPVYPRVCGGTHCRNSLGDNTTGLSPRVRGNPLVLSSQTPCKGSIPACAGEPRGRTAMMTFRTVYPRVCGGTLFHPVYRQNQIGLSPRVRGNPYLGRPPQP